MEQITSVNPMKSYKSKLLLSLIVVLFIAGAAYGTYYYKTNISLADWKTYQYNSEWFSVEFKYPPELEVTEDIREKMLLSGEDTVVLSLWSKNGKSMGGLMYLNSGFSEFNPGIKDELKTESFTVNNFTVELKTVRLKSEGLETDPISIHTNFKHRNNYNYIDINFNPNNGDKTSTIKRILSSFKYIDHKENNFKGPCLPQQASCK
jgi:hypothetical protein